MLYDYIGETYYLQENYFAALENFQKVLIISSENFNNNSLSSNPEMMTRLSMKIVLIMQLKFKAKIHL